MEKKFFMCNLLALTCIMWKQYNMRVLNFSTINTFGFDLSSILASLGYSVVINTHTTDIM